METDNKFEKKETGRERFTGKVDNTKTLEKDIKKTRGA